MTEQIKQIAERIKELRAISNLKEDALARELGISQEEYKKYESGNVDIPVSFLYKIAHTLGVELSVLLSGENPKLHVYTVVRKGKGLSVNRRKEYQYESLAYNFINKKAEPFMVTVDPEADDAPVHFNVHSGQEFNFVIEGTLKVIIDTHEVILNEGDSLYFDSGHPHSLKALNNKSAKLLAMII